MSPWTLAINNLANLPAPPAAEAPQPKRERKAEPKQKHSCPHCGQAMPSAPKRRKWTPEEDKELRQLLKDGLPYHDIARALKRPDSSIGSRMETLRIPGRRIRKGKA